MDLTAAGPPNLTGVPSEPSAPGPRSGSVAKQPSVTATPQADGPTLDGRGAVADRLTPRMKSMLQLYLSSGDSRAAAAAGSAELGVVGG